jgi:hypothetical protein
VRKRDRAEEILQQCAGIMVEPSRLGRSARCPVIYRRHGKRCLNLSSALPDLACRERKTLLEAVMNHWRDTMVERPTPDGAAYVTGWTISGIAVIATIVAVWVLGI